MMFRFSKTTKETFEISSIRQGEIKSMPSPTTSVEPNDKKGLLSDYEWTISKSDQELRQVNNVECIVQVANFPDSAALAADVYQYISPNTTMVELMPELNGHSYTWNQTNDHSETVVTSSYQMLNLKFQCVAEKAHPKPHFTWIWQYMGPNSSPLEMGSVIKYANDSSVVEVMQMGRNGKDRNTDSRLKTYKSEHIVRVQQLRSNSNERVVFRMVVSCKASHHNVGVVGGTHLLPAKHTIIFEEGDSRRGEQGVLPANSRNDLGTELNIMQPGRVSPNIIVTRALPEVPRKDTASKTMPLNIPAVRQDQRSSPRQAIVDGDKSPSTPLRLDEYYSRPGRMLPAVPKPGKPGQHVGPQSHDDLIYAKLEFGNLRAEHSANARKPEVPPKKKIVNKIKFDEKSDYAEIIGCIVDAHDDQDEDQQQN
ncbi:unnamed protein product [Notodromas monacha]|uniref:Uncharacterized protein n=1 Tax=Notodromas monacha TaxID=399045 RepID=A0A7R9GGM4_9CRUS|nr:unnamed protein product [Notodromas monacha]CAG0921873.1 unnamed protein product [Notodromas monacha]